MLLVAHRTERLVSVHRCPEDDTQHSAYPVVQTFFTELTGKDTLLIRTCKIIYVIYTFSCRHLLSYLGTELDIKTSEHSLPGVMCSSPVRHHKSVKSPLAFQDIVDQIAVVAAVSASEKVIAGHDAPCASFLHSHFKGRKIDLAESSLADLDVGLVAVTFLIVEGIMLHTGSDTVVLQTVDIRDSHLSSQERILSHIFEITSSERTSVHIDSRAEDHILLPEKSLLSESVSILLRNIPVPGRCQAGKSRECDAGVIIPTRISPVVPWHLRTHAVRAVTGPKLRDAQSLHSRERKS